MNDKFEKLKHLSQLGKKTVIKEIGGVNFKFKTLNVKENQEIEDLSNSLDDEKPLKKAEIINKELALRGIAEIDGVPIETVEEARYIFDNLIDSPLVKQVIIDEYLAFYNEERKNLLPISRKKELEKTEKMYLEKVQEKTIESFLKANDR